MQYTQVHSVMQSLLKKSLKGRCLRAKLCKSARDLTAAGRIRDAIGVYERCLALTGGDAGVFHDLAMLYFRQGKTQEACDHMLACLRRDPFKARYHFNLGHILRRIPNSQWAVNRYLGVMGVSPAVRRSTGQQRGRSVEAENGLVLLKRIAADGPEFSPRTTRVNRYVKSGHLWLAQHRISQSIEAYRAAQALKPDNLIVLESLAFALEQDGRISAAALAASELCYRNKEYAEAAAHYQKVIEGRKGMLHTYLRLAHCYHELGDYRKLIKVCKQGIKKYPRSASLHALWIMGLLGLARVDGAVERATEASRLLPSDLRLAHYRYLSLPIVYRTTQEISRFRSRFAKGLEKMTNTFEFNTPDAARTAVDGILGNFYLAYQGLNDLQLQKKYGDFVTKIMSTGYPYWSRPLPMPALLPNERIRVGYVSSNMAFQTVGKLLLGWLVHHDRDRFQVHAYCLNDEMDLISGQFAANAERFYLLGNQLEAICRRIVGDGLHILVFLDIGMDPLMFKLGGLRLAPVQCVAWGHPVTSGLPNVDYFISSELMEPRNGRQHYSEKLVCLPGTGVSVPRCAPGHYESRRAEFGLLEDAVVYLCPQSLFKYLPQYDHVFAAIASRVPKARFIFIEHKGPEVTDIFRRRLLSEFRKYGLNGHRYLKFLPRLDYGSYLRLNAVADVFLDTIGWSGGMTTLEALSFSVPVVTCPGKFMRGRHSFAFLKCLGVTDAVARNIDDYVEKAVRLGRDREWRRRVSRRVNDRLGRLFDDKTCVQALEDFYARVIDDRIP